MALKGQYALRIAGLLAGMVAPLFAGIFLPPAEGPVPFRRDKIPLEADAMSELSMKLGLIARGFTAVKPAERRGAAQTLALAMALDPANAKARELLAAYQQGWHKASGDATLLEHARDRISYYVAWLETPEAGVDGQALAACLEDILLISDPNHPQADEEGKWAGWVPELSAYEAQVAKNGNPPPPQGSAPKSQILLSKAEVHTMLWRKGTKDESSSWVLAPAPLQMTAIKTGEDSGWKPPLAIALGSAQDASAFTQTNTMLLTLLKKQHENLPAGYKIAITCKELEQSVQSRKRQSLSAAAAVLASAAVTGREPEAIIIGQVDESGTFKLPTGFWEQLMALGKGNGQRLVLPAAAATSVPSMLALEKPGFFLEYEVLLAANFQQLLELTAKTPDETLVKSSAQFHEIRGKIGSQEIRQYIANRFVRQRLADILQETPCHFSAKMLLVQASGNRPTSVTRPVLAAELRRAIEPMDWIVRTAGLVYSPWDNGGNGSTTAFSTADLAKFIPTLDLCRSRVDALERYADKNDRELVERTRKSVAAIRALDKGARTRGASYQVTAAVHTACGEFLNNHKQIAETLARETSD